MFVSDLVDGIIKSMDINYSSPINLGNPNEITINELADTIINYTGSSSKKVYKELPSDDPKRRRPDVELAKRILNWEPNVRFPDGLKNTIKYYISLNG